MKKTILLFSLFISCFSFGQSWTSLGDLPPAYQARNHPVTFSVDGYGYVSTGYGSSFYSDFWKYDPVADSWEQLDPFPGPARGFSYGVVSDEDIAYMGFGAEFLGSTTVFNDWYSYDAETETWTTLSSCPCSARWHPAMLAVGDKVYVGLGSNGSDLGDWWEYDIPTDTWSVKAAFPASQRHHPYMFALDGIAYVGFGHHLSNIFNDFYAYDPATDSWSAIASLPAEGRVAGTQFTYGGKGYVLSGQGEDHNNMASGEFWEYDPDLDEWTELPAHPGSSRWAPGSFVIENKAYLISGESNFGNEKDMWVYDFPVVAGIEDVSTEEISIYPNPSNGEITINAEGYDAAVVTDIQGQEVMQLDAVNGTHDLSNLQAGMYLIQLKSNDGIVTERLIIE